ncbi:MAG TPA: tandem-95 repeat protein [Solirubrobacteraceae bacterium]|nr:tandem-95 repeat protein [Solirubrobacteraceae bacterium]
MKVAPVSRRWGAAFALASLVSAFAAAPSAQAAAPTDRADAVRTALTALEAQKSENALTVFALERTVPTGTEISQAGPESAVAAAKSAQAPGVSARLARAGVKAFTSAAVLEAREPSWLLYADQGPSQAFEHPGKVVLVGARTGKVTISETLRWVPLVDGKLPEFFRSAAAYRSKELRVFDRPWKQKAAAASASPRAAAGSQTTADAQKRLADAIANDKSCALRVSDTLGDFYDFGSVDRTRAALGRALNRLARLNGGFVTRRYTARGGLTPTQAAQQLISRGCGDLTLYVAGSGTRTGTPGIVVGLRPRGGGIQWHSITSAALETLVKDNRNVTFKFVLDAPYSGRIAQQLADERNVTVLLTAGGVSDPSFTFLPQILGTQGVIQNTSNPMGLLEFTNNVVVGIERFSASPEEIDHAIAERAAGRSDSLMGWMLARALDLSPSLFTTQLLGVPTTQRVPVTTGASRVRPPLNRAPIALTPPQFTREDVAERVTLVAIDPDLDPVTFTVTVPPTHGTLTGDAPQLTYTPDRDFHGFDALTYRASDGRGGTVQQTVPITVLSDNDAPGVVGGPSGTPPTYTEQQTSPNAVVVDNALTVTDPDSPTLEGARIEIVTGRVAGDVLAATPPAGITAAYDASTGVLTLTGDASRADYQAALRSVTFRSTSDDPGTARTVRFSIDDGDELGLPANRDVTVVPVNDAPVNTVPGARTVAEDGTLTLSGATKLSVADADARTDAIEVALGVAHGKLAPATTTGLTVTGAGTGALTLRGPQAQLNAALDGLTYTPDADFSGAETLTVATSDLGRNGTGGTKTDDDSVAITVEPANDAPVNTVPGAQTVAEDGSLPLNGAFSVADGDAGSQDVETTLGAAHGTLDVGTSNAVVTGDGTSSVKVTGTPLEVSDAIDTVTYAPDANFAGADTITVTTDDLGHTPAPAKTDTDTVAVTVTAVNDAPVLASPAGTVNVDEDTPETFAAGGASEISVADVDAAGGDVQATVTGSAGTLAVGAVQPGLAVTGGGTGTLTLTGTVAEVNDALDGLVYTPAQDASGPATLTVAVDDQGSTGAGGAKSDSATVNLSIAAENDAPVLAPASGAVAYTEDGAAAAVAGTLTVADVDDTTLASATVRISAGRQSGDVLGFVDTAAIDGTYDAATGTLTLVPTGASATLAQYQAALRTVTFSTTNDDPSASRTITLTADDGDDESAAATRTVTITPANDAPQIANSGGTVTVTENDADGEVVDTGLTLTDPDDTQLTGATVAITANRETGDALTFTNQNGITGGAYDAATGTLALTGTATVAQYRDALRSVRFVVGGQNPTTATRTVRFTVSDGDASATSAGKSVAAQPVNDTPVNTVPGTQSVNENATLTFGAGNAISIADVDAGSGDVRVTLTATHGTLSLGGTAGLTFTTGDGSADATMTFEGTVAAVNTALAGTTYAPTNGYSGAASVEIATNDLGHSGGPAETDTDTVTVNVLGLNKAPVNQLPGAQTTDEDTALVLSASGGNALTITDPDAGSEDVRVALAVTNGTLTLKQTTGLTVTAGADGTAAVTVRGSLTAINAALDGLRYTPTGQYSGSATLSVDTDDLGNIGQGGAKTDSDTLAITVSPVNDAPALTAPAAATVAEEGTVTFSAGNVNPISVADVDSGAGTITVDLTATHGTATLGSTAGVAVTGNGTAAVQVTGTRGAVNAALEGTTFTGAADFDGAAQLKVDVTDLGNTGSGGAKTDTETIAITVTGVNDAPVFTAPANATVSQNSQRTFSTGNGNAISITDVDAGSGNVRVQLAVAQGTLTLSGTTGLTFTTGDGTADAALDVTGTLSDVNAALNGLVYRPANGYAGADQLDLDADDLGNSGTGGAKTGSATVALTVNAANSAPVNTVPGARTTNEDTAVTFTGATKLAVTDDNVDDATGELEVDLDVDHGTLTLDGTTGLTFSTGDGTNDTAMTFKGSPANINAALDGLVYTPDANYGGSDTLTIETDDLGESGPPGALTDTDTVAITVTAQNDAPVLTAPASIAADEDVTKNVTGISVADVDAGSGDIRVRLAVTNGTLTLGTKTGLSFPTGDGTDDAEIVAEGTVSEFNTALATLSYTSASNVNGADTLDLDVSDLGLTGAGGVKTDAEDVPVTVAAVNDAPVNTKPGTQTIDEDTTLTLSGSSALAVADVDASALRVTVQASQGTITLSGTAGLTFTTGDGTADTTMTFTGTKAAINTALDGLTFTPTANFNGAAAIGLTANDEGATGSGGALQDQDTVTVTVSPVNDAPVLTQPDAAALTYTEDVPSEDHADVIAPNLTVADIDDTNIASATVTLTALATGDDLVYSNQNGITGTYNAGTGTLTLTGTSSKANYETALRSVRYRTTSENPDTTQRTVTFRVNDGHSSDNLSNQVTRSIDVVRTNDAPVADDEAFSGASRAIGNTSLVVDDPTDGAPDPAGPQKTVTGDILDGDTDPDSPANALTVTPVTNAATTGGGRITIEADGDFTYLPEQGCGDTTDTYDYTVNDNEASGNRTDTGTLTISIADCIWYVDGSIASQPAAATGGTSQSPFKTLAALNGAGGAGDEDASSDRIFLYDGTYAGGLPLENSQQLLSERHGLAVPRGDGGTTTLHAADAGAGRSQVDGGTTLGTANTIQGVDFGTAAGAYALSGTSVGSLTVNTVTSGGVNNPSGGGVSITGTGNAVNVALTELTSTGGASGLILNNASGTFTAPTGTISNASGTDVSMNGGSADVTLGAGITDDAGQLVSIQNTSGGTKDFNGLVTDTPFNGNGGGIALASNTGATVRFDGGVKLSTGPTPAFSATGGGTVAVTDPASDSNVLATTSGTALNVTNTSIHADDLTFESVSSTGAVNGIVLNATGNAGGLNVTGNGGTCTVGSPTCTGGTIQTSSGAGIRADSVGGGVALSRVRVTNGSDDGIRFAESTNLSVDSSLVTANGTDDGGADATSADRDRGIDIENGKGSVAVTSSQVSGSYYDNIRFDNDNGSVDFDLTNGTIAGSQKGDGVQFLGDATASMKADVTGSTFSTNFDDAFQLATATGSPAMNLNFNTNQVSANAGQVSAGALVTLTPGTTSTTKVAMAGNTLDTSKGPMLILNPAGSAQFDATVTGNTLQNSGGVGVWGKPAQGAQSRMRIANNTITNYKGQGMYLRHGEGAGGRADFIVQGNTVSSSVGQEGMFVESGTTSSGADVETVCADIGGAGALANALGSAGGPDGNGGFFDDVAFARYTNNTLILPGFTGDPSAYIRSRNTGNPDVFSWGPQEPTNGPACQTPTLPPAP